MSIKDSFLNVIWNDSTLFMAAGFVIFTPLWILIMMRNGLELLTTIFLVMSFIYVIQQYIKYRRKNETKESIQR